MNNAHNVRKYLREYSEVTGIQGLRYLTEKRSKVEKCFWALILIISICGCLLMINGIYNKYILSPIVISIGTDNIPIFEIPFPAVTVCPNSQTSPSIYNFTKILYTLSQGENLTESEMEKFYYLQLLCNHGLIRENGNETFSGDVVEIFKKLKPDLGPYLAAYMGEILDISGSPFVPIITDLGICYSFNILDKSHQFNDITYIPSGFYENNNKSNEFDLEWGYRTLNVDTYPRSALTSGVDNSLFVMFEFNESDISFLCTYMQGLKVILHNSWELPIMTNHYYDIPINKIISVAITPNLIQTSEEVMKYSPEDRECFRRNEKPLKFFKYYSQSNCYIECYTNFTLLECDCVGFFMPKDKQTKVCGAGKSSCLGEAARKFRIKEYETKRETWGANYCGCFPLCVDLTYNIESSITDMKWKEYVNARYFGEKSTTESPLSILKVYFKENYFIALKRHQLYGITDLISNFGGILGLFTGFSLITLAEILYFLTLRIYYNIRLYGSWAGKEN